ncbi:MAG: DJ-1/PfpI family protein [Gammaproteobacteria bacterium]|nr:DJ-1/PfpI family protein [Gammaproteobacteria bacterium]MDH5653528.1 DJ-1/PfpI family protein [Gammaproteobacteria bacterium]
MANILVPLAQGCEELEAVTITDLLTRAGFNVVTAGLDDQPVAAGRGMVLVPKMNLDQAMQMSFDLIVLPGGLPGADHLNDDPRIHHLLQQMQADGKYIAAICAAPKVLARAGLLQGKQATSFPGSIPAADMVGIDYREQAVVVDDRIVTSRGPGTAMDFALTLIELLAGKAKREEVERPLQRPAA